jgi:hypothetical protein
MQVVLDLEGRLSAIQARQDALDAAQAARGAGTNLNAVLGP